MRVRAAQCCVLYFDDGRLVWDGYLRGDRYALTPASMRVLRWFDRFKELDGIRVADPALHGVAGHLLDTGVLVAEGSPAHEAEERVARDWAAWGPAPRYYHFASRTRSSTYFLNLDEDARQMRANARAGAPPAPAKRHPGAPRVPLTGVGEATWTRPHLLDALYGRRSERRFADGPVELAELATLLQVAAGAVAIRRDARLGDEVLLTSPSAGARTPVEVYAHVRDVTGLDGGVYHFDAADGALERVGDRRSPAQLCAAVGDQPWLAAAPVLLVYTAVLARSQWRYRSNRAYRDVLLGLGHLSQNVLLTATALGLGALFATATRDEEVERLVGCDGTGEVALAVTALGREAHRG